LLKSQNGIEGEGGGVKFYIDQETPNSPYVTSKKCSAVCPIKHPYRFGPKAEFDHIIYCTGWKFDDSIFQFEMLLTDNEKYPAIKPNYESANNTNLFFIGSLMHSLDFKKSSGGFIHGFRYLIKFFYQLNYSNSFDVQTFKVKNNFKPLLDHLYERMNSTSALYQMYGQMSDIFYHDINSEEVKYYSNVHLSLLDHPMFKDKQHTFYTLTLEYGDTIIKQIDNLGANDVSIGKESYSYLLHPILSIFSSSTGKKDLLDRVHFSEDLLADFSRNEKYYEKMGRSLRMFF
jgi:hypothetical protein